MQIKINYDEILNEVNEPSDKNENTEISYEDLIDEIVEEKLLNTFARKKNVNPTEPVNNAIMKITTTIPTNVNNIYDEWRYVYQTALAFMPRKQAMMINADFLRIVGDIDNYTRNLRRGDYQSEHMKIGRMADELAHLIDTIREKNPLWKGGDTKRVSNELKNLLSKVKKIYTMARSHRVH